MKNKLRSQRGISVLLSLFLLLICTSFGTLLLVVGASASGRLSGLAEAEGRYYSVTSAAKLFRDLLNGTQVTVTYSRSVTVENAVGSAGSFRKESGADYFLELDGMPMDRKYPYAYEALSLLQLAAWHYVFGDIRMEETSDDALWARVPVGGAPVVLPRTLMLRPAEEGAEKAVLETEVFLLPAEDGSLTLRFQNRNGSMKYAVEFTLTANCLELEEERRSALPVDEDAEEELPDGMVLTREQHTETKTCVITWSASGIRNSQSAAAGVSPF